MPVLSTDIAIKKSANVSDASSNGGRKGSVIVQSALRHAAFPRVTQTERTTGVTRYRKFFICNEEPDDETAYDLLLFLEHPSNGGDRFYIGQGTQSDIQSDLGADAPAWYGVGQLQTALTAGASTSVTIEMPGTDYVFPNGGKLHITDKFMVSQSVGAGLAPGDSAEWATGPGEWQKIGATDDITYPIGIYLGANTVMTDNGASEEWLDIADKLTEEEVIGAGNGSDAAPALTTLANHSNGICNQPGLLPVVTATCGSTARTVLVAADGSCSGYCSAGQINMADGAWTTDITWTTAPDNGTDIAITYRENCFSYAGNNCTVELESGTTPASSYDPANTWAAGCVDFGDVAPSLSSWLETNAGGGAFDESTYPVVLYNDGTVHDDWTVSFTGAGAYTCSGTHEGVVGAGNTSEDFSPVNPETGQPYFTLAAAGWSGVWTSGDQLSFITSPAAAPFWIKEVVPPATPAEPNNNLVWGAYWG